jgi:hypothetical protein
MLNRSLLANSGAESRARAATMTRKIGLGNSNEMCLQGLNLSSTQNSAFHHDLALLQQAMNAVGVCHLESCTPGTRQSKMVCTGTSQYVPNSIQGRMRNLKMVHISTYQHRQFLWQYILVCTGMYCLVPAQYKVVQGGTRWYKMIQGGTNNGIWRYMEVQGRTSIV